MYLRRFQSRVYSIFRDHNSKSHRWCTIDNVRGDSRTRLVSQILTVQLLRHIWIMCTSLHWTVMYNMTKTCMISFNTN